jgi:hypothetical protein
MEPQCAVHKGTLDPEDTADFSEAHTISTESRYARFEVGGVCLWRTAAQP